MWTTDTAWIGPVSKHMKSSPFGDVTQRRLVIIDVSGQLIGPVFKGQTVQEHMLEVSRKT
jgi:hypothetical protein